MVDVVSMFQMVSMINQVFIRQGYRVHGRYSVDERYL